MEKSNPRRPQRPRPRREGSSHCCDFFLSAKRIFNGRCRRRRPLHSFTPVISLCSSLDSRSVFSENTLCKCIANCARKRHLFLSTDIARARIKVVGQQHFLLSTLALFSSCAPKTDWCPIGAAKPLQLRLPFRHFFENRRRVVAAPCLAFFLAHLHRTARFSQRNFQRVRKSAVFDVAGLADDDFEAAAAAAAAAASAGCGHSVQNVRTTTTTTVKVDFEKKNLLLLLRFLVIRIHVTENWRKFDSVRKFASEHGVHLSFQTAPFIPYIKPDVIKEAFRQTRF